MRVALTGATGFVGGHLVDVLLRSGHEVRALARPGSEPAAALEARGVEIVGGRLEDDAALGRLASGAEILFHLAGLVAARNEAEFLAANRDGAVAAARAARAAGVRRVVLVSSLAVTGPAAAGRPLDESAAPRPVTPYGRSKLAGEQAVRDAGVAWTIVRPPAVYGPGDRQFLRLFRAARLGVLPLLGDGRQELSLVHAADLAEALVEAGASPKTEGRVYHAAHPAVVTQRELAQAIGRSVGRRVRCLAVPAPVVRAILAVSGLAARLAGAATLLSADKAPELLAPAWTCSSEALRRDAGWVARMGLADGLADAARAYRDAGWL
jgi:dihydroflavonol-4-reductase